MEIYMKRKLILAIAAILALSLLFVTVSCAKKKPETETTGKIETTASDDATTSSDDKDKTEETTASKGDNNTTEDEGITTGEPYSDGEMESAFEITGEEITLPDVSFEDDNG
jgi:cytoskeletal protein RodZ